MRLSHRSSPAWLAPAVAPPAPPREDSLSAPTLAELARLAGGGQASAAAIRAALGAQGLRNVVTAMETVDEAEDLFDQLARGEGGQAARAALVEHVVARTKAALEMPRQIPEVFHLLVLLAIQEHSSPGRRAAVDAGMKAGALPWAVAAVHTTQTMEDAIDLLSVFIGQINADADSASRATAVLAALGKHGLSRLVAALEAPPQRTSVNAQQILRLLFRLTAGGEAGAPAVFAALGRQGLARVVNASSDADPKTRGVALDLLNRLSHVNREAVDAALESEQARARAQHPSLRCGGRRS